MNTSQAFIQSYLDCGYEHYRINKFTTTTYAQARDLEKHVDASPHWEYSTNGTNVDANLWCNKELDIHVTFYRKKGEFVAGMTHNY